MNKYMLQLNNEAARNAAIRYVRMAQDGYMFIIREPKRSLAQNDRIHVKLTEVGEVLGWEWGGLPVDLDDLKTIFMAAYRKATGGNVRFAIGIDGQPVILDWRTRNLTKREGSEFMEYIDAYMADRES